MREIRYKPLGAWKLSSGDLNDYSSNTNNATLTGTATLGVGLTSDALYSHILGRATGAAGEVFLTLPSQLIFTAGREHQPFSISAFVTPLEYTSASEFAIVTTNTASGTNNMSGLTIVNGQKVRFGIQFSQGWLECSHILPNLDRVHVVGTYSKDSMSLYVDGEQVATLPIPSTYTTFTNAGGTLYSGRTNSANYCSAAVNNISTYGKRLTGSEIKFINHERIFNEFAYKQFGGEAINVARPARDQRMSFVFETAEHWNMGTKRYASVLGNSLHADSVLAMWVCDVNILDTTYDTFFVDYDGEGVTVSVSIGGNNGEEWKTVGKYEPQSIAFTSPFISVNVFFSDENSWIDRLELTVFDNDDPSDKYSYPVNFEDNKFVNAFSDDISNTPEFSGAIGMTSAVISTGPNYVYDEFDVPTQSDIDISTVEFWSKSVTATLSAAPNNEYQNGGAATSAVMNGWKLRHATYTTAVHEFDITPNGWIDKLVMYPTVLTTGNMLDLYKNYFGFTYSIDDSATLTMTETSGGQKIYENVWTIVQSG